MKLAEIGVRRCAPAPSARRDLTVGEGQFRRSHDHRSILESTFHRGEPGSRLHRRADRAGARPSFLRPHRGHARQHVRFRSSCADASVDPRPHHRCGSGSRLNDVMRRWLDRESPAHLAMERRAVHQRGRGNGADPIIAQETRAHPKGWRSIVFPLSARRPKLRRSSFPS